MKVHHVLAILMLIEACRPVSKPQAIPPQGPFKNLDAAVSAGVLDREIVSALRDRRSADGFLLLDEGDALSRARIAAGALSAAEQADAILNDPVFICDGRQRVPFG